MGTAIVTGAGRNIGKAIADRTGAPGREVIVNGSPRFGRARAAVKEIERSDRVVWRLLPTSESTMQWQLW